MAWRPSLIGGLQIGALSAPWLLTWLTWLPALSTLLVWNLLTSRLLRAMPDGGQSTLALAGIPLLEVSEQGHRVRMEFGWGLLVVLVGPPVIGMLLALSQLVQLVVTEGGEDLWDRP